MTFGGFLESDVVLEKEKGHALIAKPRQKDKLIGHFNLAFTELN